VTANQAVETSKRMVKTFVTKIEIVE